MKKGIILILTIIVSVLTFVFSEIFSIYHFGGAPTLLTTLYLICIFNIFEYLTISIYYVVNKILKKEEIKIKKIIGLVFLFITLLLIFLLLIVLEFDWLNWYAYSTPFYINVIVKGIKYLLPATLFLILGIRLIKNN